MRRCKYCETTEDLVQFTRGGSLVISNLCNKCKKENLSKQMLGKIMSQETKNKISDSNKGKIFTEEHKKNLSKNHNSFWKGNKVSKEVCEKRSKSLKGKKAWNKGLKFSEKTCLKMSESRRGKNNPMYRKPGTRLGIKVSGETKRRMRESMIKHIEKNKLNGKIIRPNVGKNEIKILNNIEKEKGIKIIRQFKVLGYFLDGYDKINNVVYEVNEGHHFNKDNNYNKKHLTRKNEIINCLKCLWIDIKDIGGI